MAGVSAWLSAFNMDMYDMAFRSNGYDDLQVVEELNGKVCAIKLIVSCEETPFINSGS